MRARTWLAGLGLAMAAGASQGASWDRSYPPVHGAQNPVDFTSVHFDGHRFLATGKRGLIATSPDGRTWSAHETPVAHDLHDLVLGAHGYLAAGDNGTVLLSRNGDEWELMETYTNRHLQVLLYSDGIYIAAGQGGVLLTSANGREWRERYTPAQRDFTWLCRSQSRFLGGTFEWPLVEVVESADTTGWITSDFPVVSSVIPHTGRIIALEHAHPIEAVDDAYTPQWDPPSPTLEGAYRLIATPRGIVAMSRNGQVYLRQGPGSWTRTLERVPGIIRALTSDGQRLLAVGDMGMVLVERLPTDPAAPAPEPTRLYWNAASPSPTPFEFRHVKRLNNLYVALGPNGKIATSTDAIVWAEEKTETRNPLNDVTQHAGVFVAVGAKGTVLVRDAGRTWRATAPTKADLHAVRFALGAFLAAGDQGALLRSGDLERWEPVFDNPVISFRAIASDPRRACVAADTATYCSHDLFAWSSSASTVQFMTAVARGFIGFLDAAARISPNGTDWFTTSHHTPFVPTAPPVCDAGQCVQIGYTPADNTPRVLASSDFEHWSDVTPGSALASIVGVTRDDRGFCLFTSTGLAYVQGSAPPPVQPPAPQDEGWCFVTTLLQRPAETP